VPRATAAEAPQPPDRVDQLAVENVRELPAPATNTDAPPLMPKRPREPQVLRDAAQLLRSATKFEGLSARAAIALARDVFAIHRPLWTAPEEQLRRPGAGFPNPFSVVQKVGDVRLLNVSALPVVTAGADGEQVPVSLSVTSTPTDFRPAEPLVDVRRGLSS